MKYFYPIVIGIALIIAGGIYLTHKSSAVTPDQTVSNVTAPATTTDTATPMTSATPPPSSTGTKTTPAPGTYTSAQVAAHSGASSCWAVINGTVYDLTSWINQHPGGPDRILSICGKDGTAAFEGQHGTQGRPNAILATFKIGTLAQ
jgi:cytochrome b involved in lipid metabolism